MSGSAKQALYVQSFFYNRFAVETVVVLKLEFNFSGTVDTNRNALVLSECEQQTPTSNDRAANKNNTVQCEVSTDSPNQLSSNRSI